MKDRTDSRPTLTQSSVAWKSFCLKKGGQKMESGRVKGWNWKCKLSLALGSHQMGDLRSLSRHRVGAYPETSSHATCQGTFGHCRLSSLSHCGLILVQKSGIRVRELISTSKNKQANKQTNKKKKRRRKMNSRTFSPKSTHAMRKPLPGCRPTAWEW